MKPVIRYIPGILLPAHFRFPVPLADTQVLAVSLTLRYPEAGGTLYTVTTWKTVNTADWTPDTRQNVYVQTETAEKGTDKTYE
ncbi:MAG: hypothetical protein ACLR2E_15005 [Lachnospiraceae bacterium]